MKKTILIITLIIAAVILQQSLYIVSQTEQSLRLRFGQAKGSETSPGLKLKVPFIDNIKYFDNRLLDLNAEPKEVIASDKKRIIVDAFAKYKIVNALVFYQSVRSERAAQGKINSILESSMRQVIGGHPLNALLQEGVREQIMSEIRKIVNNKAKAFGLKVVDVRIMRADLPQENSFAIYRRMQTEREREAKEFRAEGNEEAKKITSKAEREQVSILAIANKKSEVIRGGADASAIKIFARAFGVDSEFYNFYKSLEAYKNSFAREDTKILLAPQGEFFKYFNK